MKVLVYAFYFVLFAVHYCVLHTQDAFSGIPSDTRGQNEYPANAYSWLYARIDSQMAWKILFYRMNAYVNFDIVVMSNTSVSLFGDYMVPVCNSGGR
ncbi:MAG: hypothetical protein Q8N38_08560 [Bacteroidales bacterium]|nr:hypothetical protein [Bacteroidales bacterium]